MKSPIKIGCLLLLIFLVSGCVDPTVTTIDATLLPGTWKEGDYYEKYYDDGNAAYWNLEDDYDEEESIPFTWKLEDDVLTQYHETEFGAVIPKVYTINQLTTTSLIYSYDFDVSHTFTRVN